MIEHEIESYVYGSPVYFVNNTQKWHYTDGQPVPENPAEYRVCPKCHKPPTPEGHDACLGTIPGAMFACCGHGIETGYIAWGEAKQGEIEIQIPRWFGWLFRLIGYGAGFSGVKIQSIGLRYYYDIEDMKGQALSR